MGNVLLIFDIFAREQSNDIIGEGITTITQWFGLVWWIILDHFLWNIQIKSNHY